MNNSTNASVFSWLIYFFVVCHNKTPLKTGICIVYCQMYPIWRARAMWWGELQNKLCINRLASTLIFGMSLGARFHQGITTTNIILYPTGQNYYSWEFMFAKFEIARNHLWGMTNIILNGCLTGVQTHDFLSTSQVLYHWAIQPLWVWLKKICIGETFITWISREDNNIGNFYAL